MAMSDFSPKHRKMMGVAVRDAGTGEVQFEAHGECVKNTGQGLGPVCMLGWSSLRRSFVRPRCFVCTANKE